MPTTDFLEPCTGGVQAVLSYEYNPGGISDFDSFVRRVPAGSYNVAAGTGFPDSQHSATIPLSLIDGDIVDCSFTMNGPAECVVSPTTGSGEIAGVVTAGGAPVGDASVVITLGSLEWTVETGSDGRFSALGLPAGDFEVAVVPPEGSGLTGEVIASTVSSTDGPFLDVALAFVTQLGEPLTIDGGTDGEGDPLPAVSVTTEATATVFVTVDDGVY